MNFDSGPITLSFALDHTRFILLEMYLLTLVIYDESPIRRVIYFPPAENHVEQRFILRPSLLFRLHGWDWIYLTVYQPVLCKSGLERHTDRCYWVTECNCRLSRFSGCSDRDQEAPAGAHSPAAF